MVFVPNTSVHMFAKFCGGTGKVYNLPNNMALCGTDFECGFSFAL